MLDYLCKKSASGDLCINLALRYLGRHEWGLAKKAIEDGLARGDISEPDRAHALLLDICQRLGTVAPR